MPKATKLLTALFAATYLAQWLVYRTLGEAWEIVIFHRLHDYPYLVWGYVTSIFAHRLSDPLGHFAVNLTSILLVGRYLEPRIGAKAFTWLFIAAGVVAGSVGAFSADSQHSLGASGGALALVGAALVMWSGDAPRWYAPLAWRYLLLGFFGAVGCLLIAWAVGILGAPEGVGHITHLTGYLIGGGYGAWVWRASRRSGRSEEPPS